MPFTGSHADRFFTGPPAWMPTYWRHLPTGRVLFVIGCDPTPHYRHESDWRQVDRGQWCAFHRVKGS